MENAAHAFFETGDAANSGALACAADSSVLPGETETSFTAKAEFWVNIARQAFLFLPGAFLLYYAALASVFFYPTFGLNSRMLFAIAAGAFLCAVGLGSLKETKNLLVPAAIAAFGVAAALVFALFPSAVQPALFFEHSIYLFPFVLIFSRLLKHRIDDE